MATRIFSRDLSVTRDPVRGTYTVATIIDGHRVSRTYYGFNRREAVRAFLAEHKLPHRELSHRRNPPSRNPRRIRKPRVWAGEASEFFVDVWEERDRLHIALYFDPEHGGRRASQRDPNDGELVAEWWDDDARQMFEDGWFEPGRKLGGSVVDYAESVGLIRLT